jgi:hypothetical protein
VSATVATIAALRSAVEQLVTTTAALRSTVEQLVSALAAITAGLFNNYGAAATIAALVSAKFNNISTATKGNQQYNTVHFTYSMKTRNLLTPSTDSEQTHSGPAKRLNSRSSPFHQVTKQPTRINFPVVEFQHRPAG